MTEILPVSTISLPEMHEAGSGNGVCVGTPVPGVEVEIDPIGTAEFGEIIVRAPHARLGYDRLWHTTFAASQPEGWHRTGDVGHVDSAGRLWMGGRLADLLHTTSGPVAPVKIEQIVERVDGVAMAALVGVGPVGLHQAVVIVQLDVPAKKPAMAELHLVDAVRNAVRTATGVDVVAVLNVPALPVDRRHNSKIDHAHLTEWASSVLAGGPMRKLA